MQFRQSLPESKLENFVRLLKAALVPVSTRDSILKLLGALLDSDSCSESFWLDHPLHE